MFEGFGWTILGFLLHTIWQTAFIWAPIILGYLSIYLYFYYIRSRFIKNLKHVLLEVKIPKEIQKTPAAMELALHALYQTRDEGSVLIDRWIRGEIRRWFSLEMVSFGGDIHFYIWVADEFHKQIVESQMYAQYPGIEITEVEDYTNRLPFGVPGSDIRLWANEFTLTKPDAYPIKTYVDYGLDKAEVEEEQKVDPMTAALEFLGSLQPSETAWIQILVMATKKRFKKKGKMFTYQDWRDDANDLIEKLMKRDQIKSAPPGETVNFGPLLLSPGERALVERVERSISKIGFDCGIRGIYAAPKDKFNNFNIVAMTSAFKQYGSLDLNGFKVLNPWVTNFEPWADPTGGRLERMRVRLFDAYRHRAYFYPPHKHKPFVLNTEELATIFHFPGRVATTPTLAKIESKRAEPPVNLPL